MSPHGLWTAVCQERSLRRYFASFAAMRSASMIVVTLVATDGIYRLSLDQLGGSRNWSRRPPVRFYFP
jgi:hypothetical protein